MWLQRSFCALVLTALVAIPAWAQTGKISGTVTEASTGDALPGVSVVIDGTTQGAITDMDGFYTILNVSPGTYDLRASFIGYTAQVQEDLRVSTDLTTTADFQLSEETVGLAEVVVAAERPIVQADVSANVASIGREEMEILPVAGISEVLDLQAGIEPGMQIRGGGLNEVAFVLDGMNMRTGRNNSPLTNISFTSLEEVQVQTGGFAAEYGNVRAGVVNVATKDPPRNRYTFDGLFRYAPPQAKSRNPLGRLPENCDYSNSKNISADCNSWWIRPLLDPAVNMEGTAAWNNDYLERQYVAFDGWNSELAKLHAQGFDVTADDMLEYVKYTHRKDNTIDVPDYDADFTLGGPLIPGVSEKLGDLRFLASYRGTQTAYLLPGSRDAYTDRTFQLKLTSNVSPGMKVTLHGLRTAERGMNNFQDSPDVSLWRGELPVFPWQYVNAEQVRSIDIRGDEIYTDGTYALGNVDHTMLGGTFTHTLSPTTFYEVNLQRVSSKYRSVSPNLRDESFVCPESGIGPDGSTCEPGSFQPRLYTNNNGEITPLGVGKATCFGGNSDLNGDGEVKGYCVGQEPMGFSGQTGNLWGDQMSIGGHWFKTRDTSDVRVWTGRFDLTSQLNRFLQMKTGGEVIYSDYDMHYAVVNQALIGPEPEQDFPWQRSPIQGAAYAQTKLEFKGLVANLGVRLDYFNANTDWWVFDSYNAALRGRVEVLDTALTKEATKAQLGLSPRLGVSFPITENSKLYFNYGHFRQMLNASDIFGIRQSRNGGIDVMGNPNHPMPQTVAYELGFDQNLFDQYLLRISGFYRDIRYQSRTVTFENVDQSVVYEMRMPWMYEDIRGAEISISKNRGNWVRGFANFTFLQRKEGDFGYRRFFENSYQMQQWLTTNAEARNRLDAPVAEPFARVNFIFLTPPDFGSDGVANQLLGDWRVSLLGEWRLGQTFTWAGGSLASSNPYIRNNVRWKDYYNLDLRLTKNVGTAAGDVQLFADVSNVLNLRHLYRETAFLENGTDIDQYLNSLHLDQDVFDQLPEGTAAPLFIPGKDRPGTFRKEGVAFQPIEVVGGLSDAGPADGRQSAWYWAADTESYHRWNGSAWEAVPQGEVSRVLEDKAYIDMPNLGFTSFLNPRRVMFGIRYSF